MALLGHLNLFEAKTIRALEALAANLTRATDAKIVFGEREKIRVVARRFAACGFVPRCKRSEALLQLRNPPAATDETPSLRLATPQDLHSVMEVHAKLSEEENGFNPLLEDAEGFAFRTLRRIKQNRVWVWADAGGRLIFKADVVCNTSEVTYIEGVYVAPEMRGRGLGAHCMKALSRRLLENSESVSLLVDTKNAAALRAYAKAGFKLRSYYDSFFF